MNIYLLGSWLCLGTCAVLLGGGLVLGTSRRWLMEKWRLWQIKRRFRPGPPTHKYRPLRMDLPDHDNQ